MFRQLRWFAAVERGDLAAVSAFAKAWPELLNRRATSGAPGLTCEPALGWALLAEEWQVAQLLVDLGCDVDCIPSGKLRDRLAGREWCPPLHHALVRLVDVSWPDRAITEGRFEVVQQIIAKADVMAPASDGMTALHMACTLLRQFDEETVEHYWSTIERVFAALLDAGADPTRASERRGSVVDMYDDPRLERLLRRA